MSRESQSLFKDDEEGEEEEEVHLQSDSLIDGRMPETVWLNLDNISAPNPLRRAREITHLIIM